MFASFPATSATMRVVFTGWSAFSLPFYLLETVGTAVIALECVYLIRPCLLLLLGVFALCCVLLAGLQPPLYLHHQLIASTQMSTCALRPNNDVYIYIIININC